MLVISALWKAKWVQDSQDYAEKPCLKKEKLKSKLEIKLVTLITELTFIGKCG